MALAILVLFIASNWITWYFTSKHFIERERKHLEQIGESTPDYVWTEDAVSDAVGIELGMNRAYERERDYLNKFAEDELSNNKELWSLRHGHSDALVTICKVARYLKCRIIIVKLKDFDNVRRYLASFFLFLLSGGALLSIIAFVLVIVMC